MGRQDKLHDSIVATKMMTKNAMSPLSHCCPPTSICIVTPNEQTNKSTTKQTNNTVLPSSHSKSERRPCMHVACAGLAVISHLVGMRNDAVVTPPTKNVGRTTDQNVSSSRRSGVVVSSIHRVIDCSSLRWYNYTTDSGGDTQQQQQEQQEQQREQQHECGRRQHSDIDDDNVWE